MSDELEPEDPARQRVRDGVLGAPTAPKLSVIQGGASGANHGGGGDEPAAPIATLEDSCPLVCLGHAGGEFHFLDIKGQHRSLKSGALAKRGDLVSLFLGDTRWLFDWFPNKVMVTKEVDGQKVTEEVVRGFAVAKAGERLMAMCGEQGLFGPHVVLRGPGVWPGKDGGAPIVHCGDRMLVDGVWRPTGYRDGNVVWVRTHRRARPGADRDGRPLGLAEPGFAASADVARGLQQTMAELWRFRLPGSEIVCIGLAAVGYFGAAAAWRPNGYLVGGTGSGKSMLLHFMREAVPGHAYSTDTSKAGIEGEINGVPSPVFLDETGERRGPGAQLLLDLVLSASSGDGTRGLRGAADGRTRTFHVICAVVMAAVAPPPMGPQHRDRFTIVHMEKPGGGADNRAAMDAAIAAATAVGPQLWGRALASWPRWEPTRLAFREALAAAGCAPREMDQMGAILTAWWLMTEDGVPKRRQARDGVLAVSAFIRGAAEVASDDGPRRAVRFLASTVIQRDRSTDIEQIGVLVERIWTAINDGERDSAQRLLERFGIRVVRAGDTKGVTGKRIPREAEGDGLWFSKAAETLRRLFVGSDFEGERWAYELARLPSAVEPRRPVRVGGVTGPAIWLGRDDWAPPGEEEEDPATPPSAPPATPEPAQAAEERWLPDEDAGPPDDDWVPPDG